MIDVELEYRKPSKYTTSAVTCRASRKASKLTEYDSLHGAPPHYIELDKEEDHWKGVFNWQKANEKQTGLLTGTIKASLIL
jgi:hypothetical protein